MKILYQLLNVLVTRSKLFMIRRLKNAGTHFNQKCEMCSLF